MCNPWSSGVRVLGQTCEETFRDSMTVFRIDETATKRTNQQLRRRWDASLNCRRTLEPIKDIEHLKASPDDPKPREPTDLSIVALHASVKVITKNFEGVHVKGKTKLGTQAIPAGRLHLIHFLRHLDAG